MKTFSRKLFFRTISFALVLIMLCAVLPSIGLKASAETVKKVELFGNSISENATAVCFITGDDESYIRIDKMTYAADYKTVYPVSTGCEIDIKLISEKLKNLKKLTIINSDVINPEYILKMDKLFWFEWYQNSGVEDFSFLGKAKNITKLKFEDRDVTDVSFLKKMTQLTTLELYYKGTKTDFLKSLQNLLYLDIYCSIGLEGFSGCQKLSDFSNLTKLRSLSIDCRELCDISVISKFKNLESLELQTNDTIDISPLSKLTKLKSIMLHSADIPTLSPLTKLKNLTDLELWYIDCYDMEDTLLKLTTLKSLTMTDCNITNCSSLKNLKKLEDLFLMESYLYDVSDLKYLTELRSLDLWLCSDVTDISELKTLKKLETLNLSDCGVSDLSAISGMTNLKYINCKGLKIKSLKPVYKAKNLETIILTYATYDEKELQKLKEINPNLEVETYYYN